jgi:large subunit ribosomal protein L21
MYAIIQTGGKQYRVAPGTILKVESLDLEEGKTIDFEVLAVGNGKHLKIGQPFVKHAKVSAAVLGHGRGKKIEIIKFRRRKHYMKRMGHRQNYTQIKITDIRGIPESETTSSKDD